VELGRVAPLLVPLSFSYQRDAEPGTSEKICSSDPAIESFALNSKPPIVLRSTMSPFFTHMFTSLGSA
jgi:hypothetical protein